MARCHGKEYYCRRIFCPQEPYLVAKSREVGISECKVLARQLARSAFLVTILGRLPTSGLRDRVVKILSSYATAGLPVILGLSHEFTYRERFRASASVPEAWTASRLSEQRRLVVLL
jgi:hypothetical protein